MDHDWVTRPGSGRAEQSDSANQQQREDRGNDATAAIRSDGETRTRTGDTPIFRPREWVCFFAPKALQMMRIRALSSASNLLAICGRFRRVWVMSRPP